MIEPKKITIDGKEYILHKFPATIGREFMIRYPLSNIPKIGKYAESEEMMLKLMSYVGVEINGNTLLLSTKDLIDNHVLKATTLVKLEKEMLTYNFDFLENGDLAAILSQVEEQAGEKITKMLTALSASLSPQAGQPSES